MLPIQLEASEQAIDFAHAFTEDYIEDSGKILAIRNEDSFIVFVFIL